MKRLFIFLVLSLSLLSAGCDMFRSDVTPAINLDPDQEDIVLVPGVGASYDIRFTSSTTWSIDFLFTDDEGGWVSISDTTGFGGYSINKLEFTVKKNRTGNRRSVWLLIESGTVSKDILFTQGPYVSGLDDEGDASDGADGEDVVFRLSESSARIGAQGGTVQVEVSYNVHYDCKMDIDWIREIHTRSYDRMTHIFEVDPNPTGEERSATISFCGNGTCVPFTVTQSAGSGSGDNGGNNQGGQEGEWVTSDFRHRSLMMRFTADWCAYCPMMATAVELVQEQYPDRLEAISVHGPASALASVASEALTSSYNIINWPTGVVDGLTIIQNTSQPSQTASSIISAMDETEDLYDVSTGLAWNSSVSGSEVVLDLRAYVKPAGSYKLTAFLVEDGIIAPQAGGSDDYEHNGVLREAFTDVSGDLFSIEEEGMVKDFRYSASVPYGCNMENLRVVAYIQASEGGSFHIDNSATAKVGEELQLALN